MGKGKRDTTLTTRVVKCIDLSGVTSCVMLAAAKLRHAEGLTAEEIMADPPKADADPDLIEAFSALRRAGAAALRLIDKQDIPHFREDAEQALREVRYGRNVNGVIVPLLSE